MACLILVEIEQEITVEIPVNYAHHQNLSFVVAIAGWAENKFGGDPR